MSSPFPYWDLFLTELEDSYGKETIDRWARSLKVNTSLSTIAISAKDSFQVLWFEEHLKNKFTAYLLENNLKYKVNIAVEGEKNNKHKPKTASKPKEKKSNSFQLYFPEIDPSLSFERLLTHEENAIPFKIVEESCTAIIQEKLKNISTLLSSDEKHSAFLPNPIYIYGPSGSGKTHLLQAAAARLQHAGIKAMYAGADLFTEHVIKSIRAGEMSHFRKLWRTVDVLLVDDVHVLAKKSATQEEFFHTFNTLHTAGQQIILAANSMPQQLQFIEPRLISRFSWGIVLGLATLPKKMYKALLEQKAHALNFTLTPKITNLLLELFSSSPKSCCQALEALILRSSFSSQGAKKTHFSISEEHLRSLLKDLIDEEEKSALTFERIVAQTAQSYGVTEADILGKSQRSEYALPRQITMYLVRKHLKLPYMKIGDRFYRDHSTVMSALRHIEKLIKDSSSDVGSTIASLEIALQT